jgi:single-strand DNA-binding protein
MEITGRVTADASIYRLTDGREVTNFILAMNDRFTTKAGERKEVNTFIKCAYWVSPKVAAYLKKGIIVAVYGRIGLDVYNNTAGEAKGSLTCHVNDIKLITAAPKPQQNGTPPTTAGNGTERPNFNPSPETIDDLPF